jgi:hypothetical protein
MGVLRHRHRRSLLVAVALAAAACGGGGGGGGGESSATADRCEAEFAAAEKVPANERRPGLLVEAAIACKKRDVWIEVANRHPGVLGGKNALDALSTLCFGAMDARLANNELCDDL